MAQGRISIIVPVFNTGEHLRTRAFPSLAMLPQFSQMHVLLIDDGSTYQQTIEAVTELADAHPNVSAFFYEPGGSGSASRARNKGIELAQTEYIGFLDSDDEFLDDGPWPLVQALDAHPQAQLAIGNQRRIYSTRAEEVDNTAFYTHRRAAGVPGVDGTFRAGGAVLAQARFRPSNLSSFVLRSQWLKDTGLTQVPGAAGQDSLFFLQAFAAARTFVPVHRKIYAYHAETEGSMVNTVTAEYFRKCLIREQAQLQWLQQTGLYESYVSRGFERAFVWYLSRLRRTPPAQREQARALLREIAALYVDPAQHRWRYPETMAFFRRPGVPSPEGLKPLVGALRRRVSSAGRTLRRLDP